MGIPFCSLRLHLVTLLVILGLGVYLYTPVPPGVEEPGRVQVLLALTKINSFIAYGAQMLGLSTHVLVTRSLVDFFTNTEIVPEVEPEDREFDGVAVRIYRPKSAGDKVLPVFIYYHGGGWTYASINVYNLFSSRVSAGAEVAVVSVEYRRAPEHKFPIPFDDCLMATIHVLRHGAKYNIDTKRVAIGGDSAGGNLAAAVANRLTFETKLPPVKFHVLIYPLLQAFDFKTPSYIDPEAQFYPYVYQERVVMHWVLYAYGNEDNLDLFTRNQHTSAVLKQSEYASLVSWDYLPDRNKKNFKQPKPDFGNDTLSDSFETFLLNPYFSPLMAIDVSLLPPAFIITADYDCIRDDGFFYAHRLRAAGVPVIHKNIIGAHHGFVLPTGKPLDVQLGTRCVNDIIDHIKNNI